MTLVNTDTFQIYAKSKELAQNTSVSNSVLLYSSIFFAHYLYRWQSIYLYTVKSSAFTRQFFSLYVSTLTFLKATTSPRRFGGEHCNNVVLASKIFKLWNPKSFNFSSNSSSMIGVNSCIVIPCVKYLHKDIFIKILLHTFTVNY